MSIPQKLSAHLTQNKKLFQELLPIGKSFDIIIVHSALEVSIRESNCPGDYVEPAYIIGKGEIVTVFYRYICEYIKQEY